MKKTLVILLLFLVGCDKNPTGPSPDLEPTLVTTHQVIYLASSTAGDNIITYVDGDGQSHQVHAGEEWAITFTAHNGSFYVYLACASVSKEYSSQNSAVRIFIDGKLVGKDVCQRNCTLAWVEKQYQ
jgi:hypothetical protein